MTESAKPLYAFHFLAEGRLMRDDREAPSVGEWLEHDGALELCASGLHASRDIMDAIYYAPGAYLCVVECGGEVLEGDDKIVCSRRRIVSEIDATEVLHRFAVWCARKALKLVEKPDPRSLKAIEVKEAWLRGEATDAELAAARDAAWDAARDAVRNAAWAASWDAAWAAAWAAARDAAWDAAWAAARDAAWAAARGAQRSKILSMLREAGLDMTMMENDQ